MKGCKVVKSSKAFESEYTRVRRVVESTSKHLTNAKSILSDGQPIGQALSPAMTQPLTCAVNEVIRILCYLGLPGEIAVYVVYKLSGLVHPAALMLRRNSCVREASATLQRYMDISGPPHPPALVCCCKLGKRFPRRDQRYALNHRVPRTFHWITLKRDPELWLTRIHGWKNYLNADHETEAFADSFICPYARLLLRCLLNAHEPEDERVIGIRSALSSAVFPDECYVLGYDLSIAAWLKGAPYEALMEYAKGITGMEEDAIHKAIAAKRLDRKPFRLTTFILEH